MKSSAGFRLTVLAVTLVAGGAAGAAAQPEQEALDEIVVVAHKHGRPLKETAAHVTVLTSGDLQDELSSCLADAFRYIPGVDPETSSSRFGTESINIRGIGGNRVGFIIDGVPVGEHFAIGSFANAGRDFVDAGLIQRVELLHGPASALYGSDAVGGVLAISTPRPDDMVGPGGLGARVSTGWRGADDSWDTTVLGGARGRSLGALAGVSLRDGGLAEPAALPQTVDRKAFHRRSALLKVQADGAAGRSLSGGFLHHRNSVTSDLRSMLGAGRFAATTSLEGDDVGGLDLAHLELAFGETGNVIDSGVVRGWYARSDIDQRTLDVRAAAARPVRIDRRFRFGQRTKGIELVLRNDLEGRLAAHRLAAGIELRSTRTRELRDAIETGLVDGATSSTILGEVFPLRDFPVSDTAKSGAWIEDTVVAGNWRLIAAVRADRYDLSPRADGMFAGSDADSSAVSSRESDLSPKLGVVRSLTEELDVWIQYAQGFRAPPIEDVNIGLDVPLMNIRAIPNPDLRSERSEGLEGGVRWTRGDAELRISVFHTRYRDFIESKMPLGPDPATGRLLFQSRNVMEARIEGIEGAWRARLPGVLRQLTVDGRFYVASGENRDARLPLSSVGPAQAVVTLGWQQSDQRRGARLTATLTDRWSNNDAIAGPLVEPAGYAVLDLIAAQALGEHGVLRAGVMNLSDRTWWHWSAVRGLAPDDPLLPGLAQPGRSFAVSLEWNWR